MNKIAKNFSSNAAIFLSGNFGSKMLSFLMTPLYTSILSTGEYGDVDIIQSTVTLLLPIATLGIIEAIFRFCMSKSCSQKEVLSVGISVTLIGFLITFGVLCVANQFFRWPYMNMLLLRLFVTVVYEIFTAYLKATQKLKLYVATGLVQTFLLLSLNILFLVCLKMNVMGYIYATLLSSAIPSLCILFGEKLYRSISFRKINHSLCKEMLKYSIPLIFSSLSWWIISSADRYMILFFYGRDDVGVYSIASRVPLILQTLILLLQTVWQISTNEIYEEDKSQLKEAFEKFSKYFRNVGFICGSALILFTKPIMWILAKNDFYQGWIYTPILILSVIFPFGNGMVSTLYGAYKKNSGVIIATVSGAVINIILNFVFIPKIGVLGACVSTAISRLYISLYVLVDTKKILEFDRGYKHLFLNYVLAIIQVSVSMLMDRYMYVVQTIIFIVIVLLNRDTIIVINNLISQKRRQR